MRNTNVINYLQIILSKENIMNILCNHRFHWLEIPLLSGIDLQCLTVHSIHLMGSRSTWGVSSSRDISQSKKSCSFPQPDRCKREMSFNDAAADWITSIGVSSYFWTSHLPAWCPWGGMSAQAHMHWMFSDGRNFYHRNSLLNCKSLPFSFQEMNPGHLNGRLVHHELEKQVLSNGISLSLSFWYLLSAPFLHVLPALEK